MSVTPYFIGYANVEEMLRTLPIEVKTVYISPDYSLDPVPQTNVVKHEKRILIQIRESDSAVRFVMTRIGMTRREIGADGNARVDPISEERLTNGQISALGCVELWFQQRGWEVERACISAPTFYAYQTGDVEFLDFDEVSATFSLKASEEGNEEVQYKM